MMLICVHCSVGTIVLTMLSVSQWVAKLTIVHLTSVFAVRDTLEMGTQHVLVREYLLKFSII